MATRQTPQLASGILASAPEVADHSAKASSLNRVLRRVVERCQSVFRGRLHSVGRHIEEHNRRRVDRQVRLSEGTLTEIPEHLLARTKSRRSTLGGGDADAASSDSPASSGSAAPAAKASAAPAGKEPTADFKTKAKERPAAKPQPPHIAAATKRKRIPVWAVPVLVFLPIWAVIYIGTLSPTGGGGVTALEMGSEVFTANGCGGCHGATGGGGVGPAFSSGAIVETFPNPADQIQWIRLGSEGWKTENGDTYGAQPKPVAGGMPSFSSLTTQDLMVVVRHVRENLGGETFDPELWRTAVEEFQAAGEIDPAFAEAFLADTLIGGGGGGGGH